MNIYQAVVVRLPAVRWAFPISWAVKIGPAWVVMIWWTTFSLMRGTTVRSSAHALERSWAFSRSGAVGSAVEANVAFRCHRCYHMLSLRVTFLLVFCSLHSFSRWSCSQLAVKPRTQKPESTIPKFLDHLDFASTADAPVLIAVGKEKFD